MRKSNSWAARRAAASARGRRMARARWACPEPREETADSARSRALHDARGRIEREGLTYRGDGTITPWQIVRSRRGRTDQVDLIASGQHVGTMGRARLKKVLKRRPAPSSGTIGN